MTHLRTLTDEEFLSLAEVGRDELTTTAMELEFMNRFRPLLDDATQGRAVLGILEEHGFTTDELGYYLAAIRSEPSVCTASQLVADLKLAKEFRALADDAGSLFKQLHELTTE